MALSRDLVICGGGMTGQPITGLPANAVKSQLRIYSGHIRQQLQEAAQGRAVTTQSGPGWIR